MIENQHPSGMTPAATLAFDVLASVMRNRDVLQALEDEISPDALMEAMVAHLRTDDQQSKVDLVMARTWNCPASVGSLPPPYLALSFYLRVDEWFMAPDLDPVITPPSQSGQGFLVFKGEQDVFEYERSRFSFIDADLRHDMKPARINRKCSLSAALVSTAIAPLIAERTRRDLDQDTPIPLPSRSSPPRI